MRQLEIILKPWVSLAEFLYHIHLARDNDGNIKRGNRSLDCGTIGA